jgi:hypothetical protein
MAFTPNDMLRYSAVPGLPHVYVVGCVEPRVTILAQQVRALNLVHALFSIGRLGAGKELVVVGAGFAGITAAVGAAVRGAFVTVLESRDSPLHLQRGGIDRWIHPNLYDWPREGCHDNEAHLPVLNWRAGEVRLIVEYLLKGWNAAVDKYPIHLNPGVTEISLTDRIVRWTSSSGRDKRPCHAALVAVGFGVEDGTSYWRDDGLELAPTGSDAFRVSGIGDGGLVDALRLRLGSADPDRRFFAWLSKEFLGSVPLALREELLAAEREVLTATTNDREAALHLELLYDAIIETVRSKHSAILTQLGDRCRNDTTVQLVGRLPAPYSPKASALNRFLIALLQKVDGDRFRYIEGIVDRATGAFVTPHGKTIPLSGRTHVTRLGPRAALDDAFVDVAAQLRNSARLVGLDAPRLPIWEQTDFGIVDLVIADPGVAP